MAYTPIQSFIVYGFYCDHKIPEDQPKERALALMEDLPLSPDEYDMYQEAIDDPNSLIPALNRLEQRLMSCYVSS